MISEAYREQNAKLHARDHAYGCSGSKWAGLVLRVVRELDAADVLDYGCGKQTLAGMISHVVPCRGYDPALSHVAGRPVPADIVACTDVMEHVEPEFPGAVLSDVFALARRAAVFVIACERGGRKLPDGRHAHLVVKPAAWWESRLSEFGRVARHATKSKTQELVCVVYRS
jgi:hypothetical protein